MKVHGTCLAMLCFDVGRDLDPRLAETRLARPGLRRSFGHRRHAIAGVLESTRSLRTQLGVTPHELGAWTSSAEVEVAMHALGAVAVIWSFPVEGELSELVPLAASLSDNADLAQRSRQLCAEILEVLGDAVVEPKLHDNVEDYVVFHLRATDDSASPELWRDAPLDVARLLRAEAGQLSDQEVEACLANPVQYLEGTAVIVDWLGALIVGDDVADELLVLEHANIELLQLRGLDSQLNGTVEDAYATLAEHRRGLGRLRPRSTRLERVALMQADDAVLHEGFDNPLQLLGDDYLARLYRAVSDRFHFAERDTSIQRKLAVLDSIYQKLADRSAHRRSELLEWIIIILILVEVVMGLLEHGR